MAKRGRYTPQAVDWLRTHYRTGFVEDNIDDFEAEFGWRPSVGSLYQTCYRLGIKKDPPHDVEQVRDIDWAAEPEMQAWMERTDHGQRSDEMSQRFEAEFGFALGTRQLNEWRFENGRRPRSDMGPFIFEKGREEVHGRLVMVKTSLYAKSRTSHDDWTPKHVLVWEEENGPLPDGHVVVFADGDPRNFDPDNLVAVPKRLMTMVNAPWSPPWHDGESLRTCIEWCRLKSAIVTAETTVTRLCAVCGRPFSPDPAARPSRARRNRITCRECLDAGYVGGKPKSTGTCVMCGREFMKTKINYVRCPDCIKAGARVPYWKKREERFK